MKKQYIIKNLTNNTYYCVSDSMFFDSIEDASFFDSEESAESMLGLIDLEYSDVLVIIKVYRHV